MVELVCCGAINWDINLFTERLPRTGEEVPVHEIQRVSGGTAANVSVAAARILGPGRVAFIGTLGDDEIAAEQLSILEGEGVDSSGVLRVPGVESGQAYITIDSRGANEIHTYFGANLHLTRQSLEEPGRLGLIRMARAAVLMDPPLEAAEAFAGLCKESGATVIWDPGVYAELGDRGAFPRPRGRGLLHPQPPRIREPLGHLRPRGGRRADVRREEGDKGHHQEGRGGVHPLRGSHHGHDTHRRRAPRAAGAPCVNTVGCGDAFIGAFAAAKVEGMDDLEALRRGCAAGSFKATKDGDEGRPQEGGARHAPPEMGRSCRYFIYRLSLSNVFLIRWS